MSRSTLDPESLFKESPFRRLRGLQSKKLNLLCFLASSAFVSILFLGQKLLFRHINQKNESYEIFSLEESMYLLPSLIHENGLVLVEDDIFWSNELESSTFGMFPLKVETKTTNDEKNEKEIRNKLRSVNVIELKEPDWLHCGREQNRFVFFEDGSFACSRNRENESLLGEVMAYYTARLLGIKNTPVVVLSRFDAPQWSLVNVSSARWHDTSTLTVLIQWIPHLTKDTMPSLIRNALVGNMVKSQSIVPAPLSSLTSRVQLGRMPLTDLYTLLQWSDLILFDYLTGNYDRVASMQDVISKENRTDVLKETVHNLAKSKDTNSLWYIDNESSYLNGYSLMYTDNEGNRFLEFQRQMLESNCIFRRDTVRKLYSLAIYKDPYKVLLDFIKQNEPLFESFFRSSKDNINISTSFSSRLADILHWIGNCKNWKSP